MICKVLVLDSFAELTNVVHGLQDLVEVEVLLVGREHLGVLVHEERHEFNSIICLLRELLLVRGSEFHQRKGPVEAQFLVCLIYSIPKFIDQVLVRG